MWWKGSGNQNARCNAGAVDFGCQEGTLTGTHCVHCGEIYLGRNSLTLTLAIQSGSSSSGLERQRQGPVACQSLGKTLIRLCRESRPSKSVVLATSFEFSLSFRVEVDTDAVPVEILESIVLLSQGFTQDQDCCRRHPFATNEERLGKLLKDLCFIGCFDCVGE